MGGATDKRIFGMTNPIDQRVALVTGGARGIGKAIVMDLSNDHAVAVSYLNSDNKAEELSINLDNCAAFHCDLAEPEACTTLVEQTMDTFGRLDVIVNNASHVVAGNLEEANPEDIKTMFEINATVPMTLLRAALPYLSSGSSVVNLSSVNAQIPPVAASAFGASKAALEAFTIAAAKEFGPRGIRVNAIAPGIIKVDDVERPAGVLEKYIAATPMGRIGTAEEIAKVVRFLASDNSSYVTGECIRVAGGCGI